MNWKFWRKVEGYRVISCRKRARNLKFFMETHLKVVLNLVRLCVVPGCLGSQLGPQRLTYISQKPGRQWLIQQYYQKVLSYYCWYKVVKMRLADFTVPT